MAARLHAVFTTSVRGARNRHEGWPDLVRVYATALVVILHRDRQPRAGLC